MLLLDGNKQPYQPYRDVDLMAGDPDMAEGSVKIRSALEPGAYGLDPADLFLL
jgi:hypothetical protein